MGKLLHSSGIKLTGRTQRLISPLTGQFTTYYETYGIYVSRPAPTTPNIDNVQLKINTDLEAQSVDGFCDDILLMQGVFQDIYKPRIWIAEDQPLLEAKRPALIVPIIFAILIAIAIIAAAIAVVAVVYLLTQSFTTISQWILQPPTYVGGTPDNPQTYDSFAEYLSSQHNLYWYVCPKCGAGFGSKLTYPSITDVPIEEVDAYNEHVQICLGIPTGPQNIETFIVYATIAVVGVVGVVWLIGQVIGKM